MKIIRKGEMCRSTVANIMVAKSSTQSGNIQIFVKRLILLKHFLVFETLPSLPNVNYLFGMEVVFSFKPRHMS